MTSTVYHIKDGEANGISPVGRGSPIGVCAIGYDRFIVFGGLNINRNDDTRCGPILVNGVSYTFRCEAKFFAEGVPLSKVVLTGSRVRGFTDLTASAHKRLREFCIMLIERFIKEHPKARKEANKAKRKRMIANRQKHIKESRSEIASHEISIDKHNKDIIKLRAGMNL